jgi:hypothetical protein
MDAKHRRWLAKELTAQAIRNIKETSNLVFVEEKRAPILVITSGKSVFRFNPQERAEEIVEKSSQKAKTLDGLKDNEKAQHRFTCQESIREITNLIYAISQHFDDALWVLQILSGALSVKTALGAFYPSVQAGVKISALSVIDNKLRQILRLPEKSSGLEHQEFKEAGALSGRSYAVTDGEMIAALHRLKKFSIAGVARELGGNRGRVYVYDWMKRHDNMTREMLEAEWRKVRGEE